MSQPRLHWLPQAVDFREQLASLRRLNGVEAWHAAVALAGHELDFVQTSMLDTVACKLFAESSDLPPARRLAVLGSSTTAHLHPGIRVAGLRRGLRIATYESAYGQYRQELLDRNAPLHAFRPDTVLFALDAHHLTAGLLANASADEAQAMLETRLADLTGLWQLAHEILRASVLQQTVLPVFPSLLGHNEHRLPGSPAAFATHLNERLRASADRNGVHLLAVDHAAMRHGIEYWHDPTLWHRAKQEIALQAAPLYGDLAARLLAALAGRSAKALVLDLDNTLWGGVIGDDGLEGIVLGAGSAAGEAFASVQRYAGALAERGVILAVCSKNDDQVARQAFAQHPEMLLKPAQIASFVANWTDKASNIKRIAEELNIGLDALVFVDDNPFERSLVRQALPMVAVPEVPEDPALVPICLADAGYFESVAITADDRARTQQYQLNRVHQQAVATTTDLPGYLRSLDMRLQWSPFDSANLTRIVQLINKTNQFNLTTRRYGEAEIRALMADPTSFGIALRLLDRFGDNGIIAILIGRREADDVRLDSWLMSCRVLGRQVEQATLAIAVAEARRMGGHALLGDYLPSLKNAMVQEHYPKLGFSPSDTLAGDGRRYRLELDRYLPCDLFMHIERI